MYERKYFLDWLRIAAFALLIVFHTGSMYVTWDFNLKSPRIFPDLEVAMNALLPWRLALLFFISGVACRFLLRKLSPGSFALDRLKRLGPVILFGMLVIIPPQVYVELVHEGHVTAGYVEFWTSSYLMAEQFPGRIVPTWDHLWFLVYLLVYTMFLALIYRARKLPAVFPERYSGGLAWLFVIPCVWLCVANYLVVDVKPETKALVDDWAGHLRWIGLFGAGVVCAGRSDFWESVQRNRRRLLGSAGVALAIKLAWIAAWNNGQLDPVWDGVGYAVLRGVYGWLAVLSLCGFAAEYLNRPSRALAYATDAVLPVYVLHQPILLIAAYYLFPLDWPVAVEVFALLAITALGSIGIFELAVRRWQAPRFLFGLKRAGPAVPAS